MASYQQALRLKPDYAEAHHNLASVLRRQEKLPEAVASYQQAHCASNRTMPKPIVTWLISCDSRGN